MLFKENVFDNFIFPDTILSDLTSKTPSGFPIYDTYQEEGVVVVEYALAGYSAEQLKIWSEGTRLHVSASKKEEGRRGGRIASRSFENFFETKGLDLSSVTVSFIDGILKIVIPALKDEKPESEVFEIITDKKLLK